MSTLTVQQVLSRINLNIPFEELGGQIVKNYGFDSLISFEPMLVGYEEVNVLLVTMSHKYVVKIFSKDKDLQTINSNVTSLLEYYRGGIPVPQTYRNHDGNALSTVSGHQSTYYLVMDYFEGKRFTEVLPTLEDKKSLAKILAKLHALKFETSANYDPWLVIHLLREFEEKKSFLDGKSLRLIMPVVQELRHIDFSKYRKGIVHFDLHRENAMKNEQGQYCILDLASTDWSYCALDLATFIGLFCTEKDLTADENLEIYRSVIEEYLITGTLNEQEVSDLLIHIKAIFASNVLIPEFLQKTGEDQNPEQTKYYKSIGMRGLELFNNVKSLY